jgi:hypothetical protein
MAVQGNLWVNIIVITCAFAVIEPQIWRTSMIEVTLLGGTMLLGRREEAGLK